MAQYKVKCPHCGNWTLSEINRSTMSKGVRGALKKGGMKGVLTAAGTVVPGFGNVAGFVTGTVIDALYGDEINEFVDGAADLIMEDTTYSFTCPGCGYDWTMEEKEILDLIDDSEVNSKAEDSVFNHYWDYFLEHTAEICETRDTLDEFIGEIDSDMPVFTIGQSNSEYSALQYLKSWAIIIFILDNSDDEELVKIGMTAINSCNMATAYDGEYKYMQAIYQIMSVPDNQPGAFGSCNKIYNDCKSILIKDTLLKPEALYRYMDIFYYRKLSAIVYEIEQKENYLQAIKVYKQMTKINYNLAKLEGYGSLSKYYRYGDIKGIEKNQGKAIEYANKCVEQKNIEDVNDYNPDSYFDKLWMDNLNYAALMYAIENIPQYNPKKAYELASLGYKLKNADSTNLMGIMAEDGINGNCDKQLAHKYYKEAADLGSEEAMEALKKFDSEGNVLEESSNELSPEEQEYYDALQEYLSDGEISDRERKMLERVRKALGISAERAAELEAALQQPQLTDDEQEYLEAYREYLVDGEIDAKARKRLEIFRKGIGISEERAVEIENMTNI